jgi:hypothetical protein
MKRILIFIFFMSISPLIAGLYGIMMDELAYTISEDFFTKFRFHHHNYPESAGRYEVAVIGFKNNWRLGFFVGIPLTLIGIFHRNESKIFLYILKSFTITLIIAVFTALLGFLAGTHFLTKEITNWNPENVSPPDLFIAIETMNNFGYMGATIGMLLAILWQTYQRRKDEKVIGYPIE